MKQCLRCNKPCSAPSSLCEQCRSQLQDHAAEEKQFDLSTIATNPLPSVSPHHHVPDPVTPIPAIFVSGSTEKAVQDVVSAANGAPGEEQEEKNIYSAYNNMVEQSLQRLNDAARRIAADPDAAHKLRSPHIPRVNRLTPLRDISADIHRDNTPLSSASYDTQPGEQSLFGGQLPDLWPWLQEEENENVPWRTDPLSVRHMPTNEESSRIEEEDLRRAFAQGISSAITAVRLRPQKWLRILLICTTIFALLALIIDTILVASLNNRSPKLPFSAPPALILSKSVFHYGENTVIHLKNFSPASSVVVSHDIQERVHLVGQSSTVQIGPDGMKDVTLRIDTNWDPGIHTIEAEDIQTRYTASATLRIDAGPTRPANLIIETRMLDFGSSIQGANTIQPLNLQNGGSSSIIWSASSDAAWLVMSPNHGVFSDHQSIQVAGSRTHLKPGDYTGKITFSSNVDKPQSIAVRMTVLPLPSNPGAVLSVAPPVLAFTAVDGMADPANQALLINNPGTQPLYWSIGGSQQTPTLDSSSYVAEPNPGVNWLNPSQTAGMVVPGSTGSIAIQVHSQNLLPGTYTSEIMLGSGSGHSALNSPQIVSVSLTVQPRCGLTLNTGSMFFTAVSGQDAPGTQTLSLTAVASCPNIVPWSAIPSDNWLLITPGNGQLKGVTTSVMTVSVNTTGMKPGVYNGNITIAVGQNTQSVAVQLTIQHPPLPSAPIIGVAPLNLNFSTTQNQPDPPGQTVTITNTGASTLFWHTMVTQLASAWLGASPSGGSIPPGQTGNLTVNVSANGLPPGSYAGQVILEGADQHNAVASGSPQTVSITFVVLPPCVLSQPSAGTLAFTTTQGGNSPLPLQETLTAAGNCGWPVNWKAATVSPAPWLALSPSSGTFASNGQSATMTLTPNSAGLAPGVYTTSVSVTATDSAGLVAQGSPEAFTVTLTIIQPCQLQATTSKLNFTAVQGSLSSPQNVTVSEGGSCAQPVTWSADPGGSGWLVLSPTSGKDGTLSVNADATKLAPGSYDATITLSASGSGGAVVQGNPQVPVTLTVTGATVSGTVNACAGSLCSSTLPNALVALTDGSGNVVSNTTADSHGNFSMSNVPNGSYTLTARGTDAASVSYLGSTSVKVAGDQTGVSVNASSTTPGPLPSPSP